MNKPLSIQPIPYQGSKRTLAPRICNLFPTRIGTLYEPFAGSAAISLYAAAHGLADKFVIGDSYKPLVELWEMIIEQPTELSEQYSRVWYQQHDTGEGHFNDIRASFNESHDPVFFLYLVARCVKNAVRFNRQGNFTQSADKRRAGMKPDRLTRTVHAVSNLLKGKTTLFHGDFSRCIKAATSDDFVYMDPPYQGTSEGRDKRYAAQLERGQLIDTLFELDEREVPYILSYDGKSGDKIYGKPLPGCIGAMRLEIDAGRSSQATLNGRTETTVESLYVSNGLEADQTKINRPQAAQEVLFV